MIVEKHTTIDVTHKCTVVIFCGGKATRLRSILSNKPKALINLDRKPYLYGLLNQIRKAGIKRVILCVSSLTKEIVNIVRSGKDFGLEINYSFDSGLFENADALNHSKKFVSTPLLICINGDTVVDIDFKKLVNSHISFGTPATLVASKRTDQPHPGAIEIINQKTVVDIHEARQDAGHNFKLGRYSKAYSNSGIYVFNLSWLEIFWSEQEKKGKLEQGLLRTLAKENKLSAYDNEENYLIDLGTPERLKNARSSLKTISKFFDV